MKYVGTAVTFICLIFGFAILLAYPTMWAVNYLIAPTIIATLFGAAKLTVWKALALNIVTGLFRSTAVASCKE